MKDLAEDEIARLREVIDKNYRVEGDLRREVQMNIKRLQESNVIVACVTGVTCRCVASAPAPMPAPSVAAGRRCQGAAGHAPRSNYSVWGYCTVYGVLRNVKNHTTRNTQHATRSTPHTVLS